MKAKVFYTEGCFQSEATNNFHSITNSSTDEEKGKRFSIPFMRPTYPCY